MVASADIAASDEFASYADGLLCAGLLQRIFIDECHTVIMDASYRARLGTLKSLHRYRCPVVLLTATLPVMLEDWFRREMLAQTAVIIRDRTTKLNCRYRVEQVARKRGGPEGDAVEERVVETARQLAEEMIGRQKGVVYCRSKGQSETLAEAIGCGFHHSGMPDEQRREAREAWAAGRGHRWIVATTGLGTGIDIEGIVAVVHAEQPYGLVDFIQQTGRGARRAGEVVESIIIHDGGRPREERHRGFVDDSNRAQMSAFVSTPGCRRAVIAAFMDGVAGETCGDVAGAEPCDRCYSEAQVADGGTIGQDAGADADADADPEHTGRGGSTWQAFGREEGWQVKMLRRWLDEVADECAVCHVRRHYKGQQQGLASMPEEPRHEEEGAWCRMVAGDEAYTQVRREMTFGRLACCFRCKLPLDWCEETREAGRGGEAGPCSYIDKVLPVVLMALGVRWVKKLARERFGVDPADRRAFFRWAGQDRRFHGVGGTNMLALWEAIVWEAYKGGRYWFD